MDFVFAPQNLPFAVAICLLFGIALLEGALALIGIGFSSLIDNLVPDGFGASDADVDITPPGVDPSDVLTSGAPAVQGTYGLNRLLGWLAVGRLPVLIILVVFLAAFGLSGYAIQSFFQGITTFLLPAWVAWVPALAVGLPITSVTARGIAWLIPKDESSAVSREDFIGRIATITLGEASMGNPAQARLRDENGKNHYVFVQPESTGEIFATGSEVLLIARRGSTYDAIRNTSAALVD